MHGFIFQINDFAIQSGQIIQKACAVNLSPTDSNKKTHYFFLFIVVLLTLSSGRGGTIFHQQQQPNSASLGCHTGSVWKRFSFGV